MLTNVSNQLDATSSGWSLLWWSEYFDGLSLFGWAAYLLVGYQYFFILLGYLYSDDTSLFAELSVFSCGLSTAIIQNCFTGYLLRV